MDSLKTIINEIFFVNIDDSSRKRSIVDARRAYSKILRDVGFSYEYIGESVGRDHSTIIHYVKSIENLLEYDSIFERKFILANKQFLSENEQLEVKPKEDVYTTLVKLEQRLENALLEKREIIYKFTKYLEEHQEKIGHKSYVDYCKENILPLFSH
jgi:hypothetical protein